MPAATSSSTARSLSSKRIGVPSPSLRSTIVGKSMGFKGVGRRQEQARGREDALAMSRDRRCSLPPTLPHGCAQPIPGLCPSRSYSSRRARAIDIRAARSAGNTRRRSPSAAQRRGRPASGGSHPERERQVGEGLPVDGPGREAVERQHSHAAQHAATAAISNDSMTKDSTTLPPLKPRARIVAISRERAATAEYIVLRAPKVAPTAITAAPGSRAPGSGSSPRAIAWRSRRFRAPLHGQPRIGCQPVLELDEADA